MFRLSNKARKCPLWVISGLTDKSASCPLSLALGVRKSSNRKWLRDERSLAINEHSESRQGFPAQDAVRVAPGQHADMPQRNAGIALVMQ